MHAPRLLLGHNDLRPRELESSHGAKNKRGLTGTFLVDTSVSHRTVPRSRDGCFREYP